MQGRVTSLWSLVAVLAVAGALMLARPTSAQGATPLETGRQVRRLVPDPLLPVVLEGLVLDPDGTPARGAVVVSSAGGKAVTDGSGRYRLETRVPFEASELLVTAVGRSGGNSLARRRVAVSSSRRTLAPLALAQGTGCGPSWLPTFGGQPGLDASVRAIAAFDDGSGPALFVGGDFKLAGGVLASRVAKWDGTNWSALPGEMFNGFSLGKVYALAAHDDGSGLALYVGGQFTSINGLSVDRIARWDGVTWSAVGSGLSNIVYALAAFDDGSGLVLYAGGVFQLAGGVPASRMARWDGTSWSAVGAGISGGAGRVEALTVHDDGGGPALYAGGNFQVAGGVLAKNVARWTGFWSALGNGVDGSVWALGGHDDGNGSALYVGGGFNAAGGIPSAGIAKWDGSSWAPLGSGVSGSFFAGVYALASYDQGFGSALYAGGFFTSAGGAVANHIARWDGTSWSPVGGGMDRIVLALLPFDDGRGADLIAGGGFVVAGGEYWAPDSVPALRIARLDGFRRNRALVLETWSALGSGLNERVAAMVVHDDGGGPALFVGGSFRSAGRTKLNDVAKWDGSSWSTLGDAISPVRSLVVFDDGSGPALHAAGHFSTASAPAKERIMKWDGSNWSVLGDSMNGVVDSMAVYDDGTGAALYTGGFFSSAGGVPANKIARWDGTIWAPLGTGLSNAGIAADVHALIAHDDGSDPSLFVGGRFTDAGGVAASNVARWDGSSWSSLGGGVNGEVFALAVHDAGSGPQLYVGGSFVMAGGTTAGNLARWDGTSWSPVGGGVSGGLVYALATHDEGSGPALHAGGSFTSAGGVAVNQIARWDGTNWSPLGSGIFHSSSFTVGVASALTSFDDGSGPALYVGGFFNSALDSGDSYLARWGCTPAGRAPR